MDNTDVVATPFDPFGKEAHDLECPSHSGKHGHWCGEWDGLYICADCREWDICQCDPDTHPFNDPRKDTLEGLTSIDMTKL